MNKLNDLRKIIEQGKFPSNFPEFGGANLIITKNPERNYHEEDLVVYSEHASALSWLVFELKKVYDTELNYVNKYDFYPSIGKLIKETLDRQDLLFETMLIVVDQIEKEWGKK